MNNKEPTKSLFEVMGTLVESIRTQLVKELQNKHDRAQEHRYYSKKDGEEEKPLYYASRARAFGESMDLVKEVLLNVDFPDLSTLSPMTKARIKYHINYAYRELGLDARNARIREREAQERDYVLDLNAKRWKDRKTGQYIKGQVIDPIKDQWFELGVQYGTKSALMDLRIMKRGILEDLEEL